MQVVVVSEEEYAQQFLREWVVLELLGAPAEDVNVTLIAWVLDSVVNFSVMPFCAV